MPLFTPRTRAAVVLRVGSRGKTTLKRGSVRVEIQLRDQPTLTGERIFWRGFVGGDFRNGTAGTVAECLDRIEKIARRA
jgi:hypothetical protein